MSDEPTREDVADDHAVVDRIVDGRTAVLLVGHGQTEHHLEAGALPAGVTEGTWVRVTFAADGTLASVTPDEDTTAAATRAHEEQLDRIRSRQRGNRFG